MQTPPKKTPYINRDLSWLGFNYRVLQEAKDPTVPLMERIKFMAIYSSNLDEFFRIRVANIRNLVRLGKKMKKQLDYHPKELLNKVLQTINKQQVEYSQIFNEQIIPQLAENNIFLLKELKNLNDEQKKFIEDYFQDNLLPFVQPVLLVKNKIKPFLNNGALYLCLILGNLEGETKKTEYAIIKIPSEHIPRFISLPAPSPDRHDLIILDDLIRYSARWLFPGYNILGMYSIKLTRDAELYIDDEFSGNLLLKIRKSLNKRNVGPASRFVFDRETPKHLMDFLKENFELQDFDLLPEGRYHNNFDFFQFPDFGKHHLKNSPMHPLRYLPLETARNIFASIKEKDHLIHVPYHSYESVIRLFEIAAADPKVTHIKVVQYRVAKRSRIMDALMDAAQSGKQVSVFVEVKARFDEEANLDWGERLENAGVSVQYSFPGVKVHSKIALITRQENNRTMLYTYLSTGNFHEGTAKVYSDFGLFTADERLTKEVARVFSFLETVKLPAQDFEHLLVGQFNLRNDLLKFIDTEIANAKKGLPSGIVLKMNSVQDQAMIEKLYEASQAGVKIKMMIRGICCLVPLVKGFSENIEVYSIVDRYLEHSRIFIFHNNGDEKIYLSSADWMVRNLSYRIETAFPIFDPDHRKTLKDFIDLQFKDNVKSRILDAKQSNKYRENIDDIVIRAQYETYYYLKRKAEDPAQ